jgi:uncharacterized protein YyaL (SSP411 family)
MADTAKPTNRLAHETSPYLLQHAHNPVDWYPWGDEAFAKAKVENKPVFLSIGYSACHWCHVMERESFEDAGTAATMNEHFVNVKVDREERPDVDAIYMAAVQAITGHGGWPMSVFLTPDGRPFYGGTYFPPADRQGMPGFGRVLEGVAKAWRDRRAEILASAGEMTEQLQSLGQAGSATGAILDPDLLDRAARALSRSYEPVHGGFGQAPKFPHAMDLQLLLRRHARTADVHALHMVRHTLDRMARGGIYDQLGGGFARYSTDDRWLVPHFEKMLYDNALLTTTYLEAYQAAKDPEDARVARETIDYVLGRMTDPDTGAFYATEDADSEGEEGKYYAWTAAEVREVLGDGRFPTFARAYDVTDAGNWEGRTILNLPAPLDQAAKALGRDADDLRRELAEGRAALLAARERRVPPAKDTKVLVSWNGLMIAAMALGGRVLDEPRYLAAAAKAAGFLLDRLRQPDGRLLHVWKDGRARLNAYLDDHAALALGLTRLYEATGEPRWIEDAAALADAMLDRFADPAGGAFFYTGSDHEALIVRQKEVIDNATPAANALAATALLRLGVLTGRERYEAAGRRAIEAVENVLRQYPTAAGQSLLALDFHLAPSREYAVIAGDDPAEFEAAMRAVFARYEPNAVVAPSPAGAATAGLAALVPLLADRPAKDGHVTTYVCQNHACKAPIVGVAGLAPA